jgi:multicomponent Na+:H+ antiporter subunit B
MIGLLILGTFSMLAVLAWMAVSDEYLSGSVVYFMAFGLGSTVMYVVFSAPDVALTEAVIGAGVSGVVFLVSLLQTQTREDEG